MIFNKTIFMDIKITDIQGGFGPDKKAVLASDIAKIHGRALKDINRAINNNTSRFILGTDIMDLKYSEVDLVHHGIMTQNAYNRSKSIYILSERGYAKLLKILEDDTAWEIYDKFCEEYFSMRQLNFFGDLSPQLQALINIELRQNKIEEAVEVIEEKIELTETKIDDMKDIIVISPSSDWRRETNKLLNKIAKQQGVAYDIPKKEAYAALANRANCRPSVLLINLKKRALNNNMAPSKVEKLNILDVLENNERLREVYVAVVKDMALKYL